LLYLPPPKKAKCLSGVKRVPFLYPTHAVKPRKICLCLPWFGHNNYPSPKLTVRPCSTPTSTRKMEGQPRCPISSAKQPPLLPPSQTRHNIEVIIAIVVRLSAYTYLPSTRSLPCCLGYKSSTHNLKFHTFAHHLPTTQWPDLAL
jgi:hypothetical protein